jgi:hypothetical protein
MRPDELLSLALLFTPLPSAAGTLVTPAPNRVTILYDAFGGGKELTRDWGFAALVEYGGSASSSTPGTTPTSSSAM